MYGLICLGLKLLRDAHPVVADEDNGFALVPRDDLRGVRAKALDGPEYEEIPALSMQWQMPL